MKKWILINFINIFALQLVYAVEQNELNLLWQQGKYQQVINQLIHQDKKKLNLNNILLRANAYRKLGNHKQFLQDMLQAEKFSKQDSVINNNQQNIKLHQQKRRRFFLKH
mgnify:CR=1 FL=1